MKQKEKQTVVKMNKIINVSFGTNVWVKLKVNGRNARFLLDCGASVSCFDEHFFEKFKNKGEIRETGQSLAGLGGQAYIKSVVIDKIELGKWTFRNRQMTIIDLSGLHLMYTQIKVEPFDGVLGQDFIMGHKAMLDFKKMRIVFSQKSIDNFTKKDIELLKKMGITIDEQGIKKFNAENNTVSKSN